MFVRTVCLIPDSIGDESLCVVFTDNGGRYDSHPPPERDAWGPGTRVPAFLFGPFVKYPFVDTEPYETASLLKFFKDRYALVICPL